MARFTLTIKMGNAAMEDPGHVARALRETARKLEEGRMSGKVMDENGNAVGSFNLTGMKGAADAAR